MSVVYEAVLDPTEVAEEEGATPTRTPLDLNSGPLEIEQNGIDWGEAAIQQYLAEQRYGQTPVGFRIPNRVITIPLIIGGGLDSPEEEAARAELQKKVGLLQAEGGILMRKRLLGTALYADIVGATLTIPDKFGETGQVETGVVLKLECLPDFYGELVTLEALEGTGEARGVLQAAKKAAVIDGDYPARAMMVLTEKAGQNQKTLLFGVRSRNYDAATSAALAIDAASMTPLNGAAKEAQAGTYSGEWVRLAAPEPETWHPFLSTDLTGGVELTHLGTYRVIARVSGENAAVQLRLAWSLDDATTPVYNPPATYGGSSNMELVDLGEVNLEEAPVPESEHWWRGIVQVETGAVARAIAVDRVWLQPVSDGAAGRLLATGTPSSTLLRPSGVPALTASSGTVHAGTAWVNPSHLEPGGSGYTEAEMTSKGGTTQGLTLEELGFAIPVGATIHGIEVKLVYSNNAPATMHLGPLKAGAVAGTAKLFADAKWPGVAGGPTDLWGTTWTPAQINATNFGFYLWVESEVAVHNKVNVEVPIVVRVYYSFSSGAITEDAVLYSTRVTAVRYDGSFRADTTSSAYVRVSEELGELFRLPPSGLEKRPVELWVKNSRGLLGQTTDLGIDKIKATITYRPCFLGRI